LGNGFRTYVWEAVAIDDGPKAWVAENTWFFIPGLCMPGGGTYFYVSKAQCSSSLPAQAVFIKSSG
jgi:hypothetical protein